MVTDVDVECRTVGTLYDSARGKPHQETGSRLRLMEWYPRQRAIAICLRRVRTNQKETTSERGVCVHTDYRELYV